ncbi:GDSL-like Lipase/Acylhydrolase [Stieleria maiorica]|uniref:GDSL-like Lipase/Acylhydrolase n=1 Tax=Stieleria maiorica TaxID=2795974 RepID=A0A5B9MFP1_9BACT|nr:GDSL-type esterase/lipase family protein [Stieleria maiorica]QEG00083.1 GDSL-like Lipase/Acylhydrolase [Stieleria maiorica]
MTRCLFLCVCLISSAFCVGTPVFGQDSVEAVQRRFSIPADEAMPGAGPVRRYDWFKNLWNQRRTTFEANGAASQGAVVFLGDSITQGWRDDFSGALAGMPKANRGISGDTTRGMLYRLEEDVIGLNPAAVVMLMGTNDLEEKASPEQIAGNVKLILTELKQHNPHMPIVLCEVFPSSATKSRPAEKIQEINRLYRELAKGDPQITVIDTWTLFADENGDAKPSEFPDLLHPNAAGYTKWEAALRPIFATLGLIETETDSFKIEPDAVRLFNGTDLTGWGYRRTTDQMRKSRDRWIPNTNGAVVWPLVEQDVTFDGKTETPEGRYRAIAGRLVVTTPPEGRKIQQLWTTQEFNEDFQLILEFRATPMADSGVFIRGNQLQCRDYALAGPYKTLDQYRPGDWNELVVTVKGTSAHCTCNGEVIEDAFQVPASGPIGLEGDRGQVEYRRIRLRKLGS